MTDRDDFKAWVETVLYQAEVALHDGDSAPRRAIWSRREPVSVLGAMRNAHGQAEVEQLFADIARSFSGCTAYRFELLAYDVVADMAYTAGFEHVTTAIDGQARTYSLRSTQVYRREAGEWKVAHRHGDMVVSENEPPTSVAAT
jgi:ketosteroid isomerase-like protein